MFFLDLNKLKNVLERLSSLRLKLNPNKCKLCKDEINKKFLGHTMVVTLGHKTGCLGVIVCIT